MTEFKTQQYINGQWLDALNEATWNLINPADETVLQQVPYGGRAEAQLALEAAANAFPEWATTSPYRRARVLQGAANWIRDNAKALARITTEESGKPFGESLGEWRSAPSYIATRRGTARGRIA